MNIPGISEVSGGEAATGVVALALLWKLVIYFRRDVRGDKREEKEQQVSNTLFGQLQIELSRQDGVIKQLAARLDAEIDRRVDAEQRYDRLWDAHQTTLERMEELETIVHDLGGASLIPKPPPPKHAGTTDDAAS